MSRSTYYAVTDGRDDGEGSGGEGSVHRKASAGRPVPGYSLAYDGRRIPDETIKSWICDLIEGDGFPYGYRKLTVCLKEDYFLQINHKKVYRLCAELGVLLPQRRIKQRRPKRIAKRMQVDAPNQLWEMDIKYGYIAGTEQFFFQLSLIDVMDREVISYHLGLSCTAKDAVSVLKQALRKRNLDVEKTSRLPVVRTDNGPQFIAKAFARACEELRLDHQRIPVKTPNMNAHIESFHAILEQECYSRHEFMSFQDAYRQVSEYMSYYNERRRHGSLGDVSPTNYHLAIISKSLKPEVAAA